MIVIGIFSKVLESYNPDSAELLKRIAQITPDDIDRLIAISRNSPEDLERDDTLNSYLSLVSQVFGGNDYLSLGDTVETRQQRYEIYDEMDESTSYISAALDILSDDATQPDEAGVVLAVVSESAKVKSLVEDLFEDLDIESQLGKWARAIAKYGDLFIKVKSEDGEGVVSINDTIYPSNIERRDLDGKLAAFCDSYDTLAQDHIYAPWEFIHFRLKGDIHRSQRNTRVSALNDQNKIYSLTSAYGQSILRPAIKVYAQLRFVENLILLSRLTNSIRRNIFLINTGETDPAKAFETIRNYADLLKKDISLDIEKGIYNAQRHTFSYDEDIFLPVNDTRNDVRIESIGGDVDIAEQYDLEYLLNKLFSSLKIPKAYLNYEQDLNARSTLIQLDIRYARSVGQIQTALVGGLLRLACIHLARLGIDPDSADLDIHLTNVSSIDKEARLEQKKVSVDTARTLWDMLTSMNDKLNESKGGAANAGIPGMGGMVSENTESSETPMDLEYVAEHILAKYFELGQEDVNRILRKSENKTSEDSDNARLSAIRRRRSYPNSDLREAYPMKDNLSNFTSLKESLISTSEVTDGVETLETKDF